MANHHTHAARRATRVTPTVKQLSRAFWAMTPDERVAAMRRGELNLAQLAEWSRQAPNEVPMLNGTWEWIAIKTPEVAEVNERARR